MVVVPRLLVDGVCIRLVTACYYYVKKTKAVMHACLGFGPTWLRRQDLSFLGPPGELHRMISPSSSTVIACLSVRLSGHWWWWLHLHLHRVQ